MKMLGLRNFMRTRFFLVSVVLAFFGYLMLSAADKKAAAPAPKAAAPAAHAAAPAAHAGGAGGAAGGAHGPTTTSHGPTTTSGAHSTTTTTHGATTTAPKAGGATTTTHATTSTGAKPGGAAGTPGRTATGSTGKPAAGGAGAAGGAKGATAGGAKAGAAAGGAKTGTAAGASHGWSAGKSPKGASVSTAKNGATVAKRPDGHVASIHDTKRNMDVHHGLNGNRRVSVERADHSRVVVDRRGRGFVERGYGYHGHDYRARSYYYGGRAYNRYYGNYYYHGMYVNPYYPGFYYAPAYYGWAYNPWVAPVPYAWGWGGNPWYGYYGAFFTPYPVYPSAAFWLTDYIVAQSLQAAYVAQAAALSNVAPMTPDVKQMVADEVKRQLALENAEAQGAAKGADPDPASSSIQRILTDGSPHVFVAGLDLDVVDSAGSECAISEGDALQLQAGPLASDATAANLTVLASKGGKECPKGDLVSVGLQDLQDMQNHMRETIGQGMQELKEKAGKGGLPAAPAGANAPTTPSAMASAAPPPDQNVQAELNEQQQQADQAEKEAGETPAPIAPPPADPVNIAIGQTIDQVTAALGNPTKIVDLGAKKLYVYKDMKITFKDGKVSDVQ
jgi:hypothetical protein